jgi:hypothetical protein
MGDFCTFCCINCWNVVVECWILCPSGPVRGRQETAVYSTLRCRTNNQVARRETHLVCNIIQSFTATEFSKTLSH